MNWGRGGGGLGGGGEGYEERQNAISYNNAFVDGPWGLFRNAGAMRLITRKASLAGIELPMLHIPLMWNAGQALQVGSIGDVGSLMPARLALQVMSLIAPAFRKRPHGPSTKALL